MVMRESARYFARRTAFFVALPAKEPASSMILGTLGKSLKVRQPKACPRMLRISWTLWGLRVARSKVVIVVIIGEILGFTYSGKRVSKMP